MVGAIPGMATPFSGMTGGGADSTDLHGHSVGDGTGTAPGTPAVGTIPSGMILSGAPVGTLLGTLLGIHPGTHLGTVPGTGLGMTLGTVPGIPVAAGPTMYIMVPARQPSRA